MAFTAAGKLDRMVDVKKTFVRPDQSIEEAVAVLQSGGASIALVVDSNRHLLGTITDGDVRRAILNKIPLSVSASVLLANASVHNQQTVFADYQASVDDLLALMKQKSLRHIPLLNKDGEVVGLALFSELVNEAPCMPLTAVIMAGGMGARLRPLTEKLPKPMLLINNRPLLERVIEQLHSAGITKIYITTFYKSEFIVDYFGDGTKFGVNIQYINETNPLGTAGALSLMESPSNTTLVINGDILTRLDFRTMHNFHSSQDAMITVGVRIYEFNIPYGVIKTVDMDISDLEEKPVQQVVVNAGIYLLEPQAYQYIPKNQPFNMTDLINGLIKEKHRVISFPIPEYWLDVGRPVDYQQANEDSLNGVI